MRRLSAIAAAGLTTACLVGVTPWVAQAQPMSTGVHALAADPGDPATTPSDTPSDSLPPTTPSDTQTTPTDPGTSSSSSSSTTSDPTTGDGGGIGDTVTVSVPPILDPPGSSSSAPGHGGSGNGNGNGGSVPTGGLGGGNAGADGAVQDGACGGLLCAGSSYQDAVGTQDPVRAQSSAQSSNPVLAYTGANILPLLTIAAALLMLGIGTLVVRSRLQAAHQRRH